MTYLEQLLEGKEVEWRPLGEVCRYEQPAKYIVESTDYKDSFPIPVLTAGKTFVLGYTDEVDGIYPASKHPVIIFDDFTGALRWIDFDFKVKSSAMKLITSKDESLVLLRFVFYWLSHLPSLFIAHDHQRLWLRKYAPLLIPLPPLAVQEQIVEILDKFTALEAELEAELEARGRQFRYYRNKLLRFGKEVEWRPLGEVAELKRGVRVVRKQLEKEGQYPVYQNCLTPLGYFDKANCKAETAFVIMGGSAGKVGFSKVDFWAADDCLYFITPEYLLSRYLYYFLCKKETYLDSQVRRAAVPRLARSVLADLLIPLPPLAVQEQIVAVLDKFETLVHSIREGLPAEIALRRQQYKYYRRRLLDFPKPKQ